MMRPTGKGTQMGECVTEDDKKEQRQQKYDNDNDDKGECEAGNVDSGFLSGGNLQFSGEISGDSGLLRSQEVERWGEGEGGQIAAAIGPTPKATTPASSSAATSAAIVDEAEPMRTIDSGVDLDLTETLSQLSLKQVNLNPLAAKGGKSIQTEPTTPELLPVSAKLPLNDEDEWHRQGDNDEGRVTSNEDVIPWQLYYTQDDDGDT